MFCDASGRPWYPGRVVKEFDWVISNDTALPAWLVAHGTSPVLTYTSPATGRGVVRCQTKVATPTSGDAAGVQTAFNIDTAQFTEIALICYGVLTDGNTGGTDHSINIQANNGSTQGFFLENDSGAAGAPSYRVYSQVRQSFTWDLSASSAQKRKDIGIVIRPNTREFFVCSGDPAEGAGVVAYNVNSWTNVSGQPFAARIITRAAAQRWIEFQRIKLRLVSN